MTKIVINRCYGGFSLSDRAMKRYGEINGMNLVKIPYKDRDGVVSDFFGSWYRDGIEDDEHHFFMYEIERTDPILVQVVEELGVDADGDCASLHIEELPAGTRYRIQEYDGREWIETYDSIEWSIA